MRILIQGAGSVGLGLGSFLLAAGQRVALLGREASVAALRAHGLRRTGCFGWHTAPPETFDAASSLDELAEQREGSFAAPDFVLVAVKSFDSEAAADELASGAARLGDAPLVLCQNGWGNAEIFAARFPEARVWNARVITGFRRAALHHVDVTVHAEPLRIGSLFGEPAAQLAPLCRALAAGGLPTEPTDTIGADLWAKLLYNGCLNPACAILGVPYGALGTAPPGRALIEALASEIFAVMHAAGWHTHWNSANEWLDDFFQRLLPRSSGHFSAIMAGKAPIMAMKEAAF